MVNSGYTVCKTNHWKMLTLIKKSVFCKTKSTEIPRIFHDLFHRFPYFLTFPSSPGGIATLWYNWVKFCDYFHLWLGLHESYKRNNHKCTHLAGFKKIQVIVKMIAKQLFYIWKEKKLSSVNVNILYTFSCINYLSNINPFQF